MSSSRHSSTESARADRGRQALVVALHKADRRKEHAACQAYLKRALNRWRRQDGLYPSTTTGLYQALCDELALMVERVENDAQERNGDATARAES